jgi:hypothetical protein
MHCQAAPWRGGPRRVSQHKCQITVRDPVKGWTGSFECARRRRRCPLRDMGGAGGTASLGWNRKELQSPSHPCRGRGGLGQIGVYEGAFSSPPFRLHPAQPQSPSCLLQPRTGSTVWRQMGGRHRPLQGLEVTVRSPRRSHGGAGAGGYGPDNPPAGGR